jgi:hypothetical protein
MATKTWTGAGANELWNTAANWSGGTIPVTGDDIIFDGVAANGKKNCTLNVGFTALSVTFTSGYSNTGVSPFNGTFTFGNNLVIGTGGLTLGINSTYATNATPTSYSITFNATCTFTANGKILPTNVTLGASATTLTINGNADFGGNILQQTTSHTIKSAVGVPCDLKIGGNIVLGAMTTNVTDHVTIKGYGGTLVSPKTFSSNSASSNARVSFISGSFYTSSGSSALSGASFLTVEIGGQFNANAAHTFNNTTTTVSGFNSSNNSDFFAYIGGTLVLSTDTVIKSFIQIQTVAITITSGASKLLLEGNLTSTSSATTIIDRLEFSGTTASTVSAVTTTSNLRIINLSFNKTGAGSVNFTSTEFRLFIPSATTYTWTHTSGAITYSPTSVIRIQYNTTSSTLVYSESGSLSTLSTINSLILSAGILQINSPLRATTLTILGTSIVFTGSAGWTCDNLICSTQGTTITLQSLITYTTTTSVNMLGANASRILMRSSDLTIPYDLAIWTFNGNTQSMVYVNATAINSSLGQTIWSFQGTTNGIDPSTLNWNPGTKPETQGITFVN